MIVALLLALLAAMPMVPACGGSEGGGETLLVGVLADLSGPAAGAMQPAVKAIEDYLTLELPQSDHPLPGNLKVEFTRYDTRLDYFETMPGYLELKDRGADLMVVMNPQDRDLLGDLPGEDGIPTIGTSGVQSRLADDWMLALWSPAQSQAEVEMMFIRDDWDYEGMGRKPKVGHLGSNLRSSECYQAGIEMVLDANPSQFTWTTFEKGLLGNEAWGGQVSRLKDCDYIIVSVPGSMLSSFVAQARAGGCTGKLVSGLEGFPGFWPLVSDQVASREQMNGCCYVAWWPWWNEDVPLIRACRDYIARTYEGRDAEDLSQTSSVICGRELGMVLEEAIRKAIEQAGVEDLDGRALQDGLRAQATDGGNCLEWSQRVFEYSAAEDAWAPAGKVYEPVLTGP